MKAVIISLLLIFNIVCAKTYSSRKVDDDVNVPNDDDVYDVDHNTLEYCETKSLRHKNDEFDRDVFQDGKTNCVEGFSIPNDVDDRQSLFDEVFGCLTQFQDYTEEFGTLVGFSNCVFDTAVEQGGGSTQDTSIYPKDQQKKQKSTILKKNKHQ